MNLAIKFGLEPRRKPLSELPALSCCPARSNIARTEPPSKIIRTDGVRFCARAQKSENRIESIFVVAARLAGQFGASGLIDELR